MIKMKTGLDLREEILKELYTSNNLREMDRGEPPNEYTEICDRIERKMRQILSEDWGYEENEDGEILPNILEARLKEKVYKNVKEKILLDIEEPK